jgi:hypothetical protein
METSLWLSVVAPFFDEPKAMIQHLDMEDSLSSSTPRGFP